MSIHKITSVSVAALAALTLGACGGSEASEAEVCDSLTEVAAVIESGDDMDPAEAVGELVTKLEAFVEIAPDDINSEAETLLDGTKQVQETLGGDSEPSDEDLAFLEDEEYDEAGDKVGEYAERTCDVNIG